MTKPILIYRCTNFECNAVGRCAGKKVDKSLPESEANTKTKDADETKLYAENNPCSFCGSKLKTEFLD